MDIEPIQNEINEGISEMNIIYVTIWICWALAMAEFVTWVMYLIYKCIYGI